MSMDANLQHFLNAIACFVLGGMLGYGIRLQQHLDEVAAWKKIARQAQYLNALAETLKEERANGNREHTHIPDGDD